jgi:hypothetical protein
MFIIDDILLAPLKGFIWLGEKINDVVEREWSDEGHLKEQLMELQFRFELDEINEETYTRQEKELLDRLNMIHGEEVEKEDA